jgi:hypothetical protein
MYFSLFLGGVEVGESITHAMDGQWKRMYRIRLNFENPVKIMEAFGIDFEVHYCVYLWFYSGVYICILMFISFLDV